MKPEPLKDKEISIPLYLDSSKGEVKSKRPELFIDKDIKSAVEWLKEQDNDLVNDFASGLITVGELVERLEKNKNKAFEDVKK